MLSDDDRERLWNLTDKKDYGPCFPPPMEAQVALNELCEFLLPDDFYTFSPSNGQSNTEIVYAIESAYKKSWTRRKLKRRFKS